MIKKLIIGVALLAAFILPLNALYMHTYYYRTLNGMDRFADLPEHISAANFGNSHSNHAFDWSLCPAINGVNMALDSQTLAYDRSLFSQFYDRFDEGAVLLLGVSVFSLYIRQMTQEQDGAAVTRYYPVLDAKYIDDYSFVTAVFHRYLPVLNASFSEMLHIVNDSGPSEPIVNDISGYTPESLVSYSTERAEAGVAACGGTALGVEYEALLDILRMAADKQMHVVLVTLPATEYYCSAWPDDFVASFERDMAALLAENPGLIWLDYRCDARICNDLTLFSDADHLNSRGSAVFMRLLSTDLAAYGIDLPVETEAQS